MTVTGAVMVFSIFPAESASFSLALPSALRTKTKRAGLLLALVGFNLGVETGQLAIVAVFLPLAYSLRRSWFYRRAVLTAGSWLIAGVAGVWFVERAFNVKWLPF
jgi:hypothetical protein